MAGSERTTRLLHIMTVADSLGFVAGQVGYMKARGFHVSAMSSPGDELDRFAKNEGIGAIAVNMPRRISPINDLQAVREMSRHIRALKPDIVHAHTPKGGLLGMIAAKINNIRVRIYHIHGLPLLTATGYRRPILRWSEKTACRLATQVLCVSRSVRDVVVSDGLCASSKIKVLLEGSINGIDAENKFNPDKMPLISRAETRAKLGIPSNAQVIGFIGRIVRDKGLIELTQAWNTLKVEYPDLHMIILGPFEPRDSVPLDIEQVLKTDPRIHLIGLDWNTPPYYMAMDIIALPTYREGFPVVPMEAAAMRLPIVTTNVPGCIDAVIDGETGILAPPRDSNRLTAALRCYLNNPSLRKEHGLAARQRVLRDYRPESMWEAVYQEYMRLLPKLRPSPQEVGLMH